MKNYINLPVSTSLFNFQGARRLFKAWQLQLLVLGSSRVCCVSCYNICLGAAASSLSLLCALVKVVSDAQHSAWLCCVAR